VIDRRGGRGLEPVVLLLVAEHAHGVERRDGGEELRQRRLVVPHPGREHPRVLRDREREARHRIAQRVGRDRRRHLARDADRAAELGLRRAHGAEQRRMHERVDARPGSVTSSSVSDRALPSLAMARRVSSVAGERFAAGGRARHARGLELDEVEVNGDPAPVRASVTSGVMHTRRD
jgi:hypothetical protein